MNSKFNVKGMHCKSCEMLIQDGVSELDGIKSIEADYKKGVVIVEYDEKQANEKAIRAAIEKEGYKVV